MTNLEARVWRLEKDLRLALQAVRDLKADVGRLSQAQRLPGGGGGGGTAGGAFTCIVPGGGIPGHGTVACTVNSVVGGVSTAVAGTPDVFNPMPDPCIAARTLTLIADGAGGYVAYSQSCS